jgi:hypothetical protein
MSDDDQTGFKQPPSGGQFKPGNSGNPSGRPKGSRNLRTDLTQLMKKKIAVRENGKSRSISRQEAMLLRLYDKALHGDVKAATSIINMIMKLDPTSSSENLIKEATSETDKEIISDFLRRHQQGATS